MPLIDTDGWWRKHAVTAEATIVEVVGLPHADGGQKVVADLTDPDSGQIVRVKSTLHMRTRSSLGVGQRIKVRWSAKRQQICEYVSSTVPKDEWLRDVNTPVPAIQIGGDSPAFGSGAVQLINASGADPASVLDKLGGLRAQGLISEAQWAEVGQQLVGSEASTPPSPTEPPISPLSAEGTRARLKTLERLHADGIIDQPEYERQRQRSPRFPLIRAPRPGGPGVGLGAAALGPARLRRPRRTGTRRRAALRACPTA